MFKFDGERAYTLLKKISYPRISASREENKAADIIVKEMSKAGIKCHKESFHIPTYHSGGGIVEVVAPYRKVYQAKEYGLCGATSKKGVVAEMQFVNSAFELEVAKLKGKIPVFYGLPFRALYEKYKKNHIPAFVQVVDPPADKMYSRVTGEMSKRFGKTPGVTITYEDGLEMFNRGAKKIRVVSNAPEYKGTSYNIITTFKGTEFPDEVIFVCGHYDSVARSSGAVDNAGGSVCLAEYARFLKTNPLKRTVVIAWFGSEEIGLHGSFDYVKNHKKDLKKIKLLINMDVGGLRLGANGSNICGNKAIESFVTAMAKEQGLHINMVRGSYSSDNIPFNRTGIPSVALYRYGGSYGHTPGDEARLINGEGIRIMGELGLEFLTRVGNSVEIPFDLKIEDKDNEAVANYIKNGMYPDTAPKKAAEKK